MAFISSATSSDLLMYSDGLYVFSVNFGEDKDIVFEQPSYTLGVGTVEPSVIFGSRRAVVNEGRKSVKTVAFMYRQKTSLIDVIGSPRTE